MDEGKASDTTGFGGSEPVSPPRREHTSSFLRRRAIFYAAGITAVFLLGLLPMWFKAASRGQERDAAQRELRLAQVQLVLASAAIDARRGNYEPARQGTATFFNLITAELDRGVGSALPSNARSEFQPLLAQRDDLITLLARGDPASAERLADAHASLRKMLGQ